MEDSNYFNIYKFDDYFLDEKQRLLFNGFREIVPLGQKSFECLLLLVKNPDRVVRKEEFFEQIWKDSFVEDAVLAVNISNIRKTLREEKESPKFILTIPRNGYKFVKDVEFSRQELLKDSEIFAHLTDDSSKRINETQPPIARDFIETEVFQTPFRREKSITTFLSDFDKIKLIAAILFLLPSLFFVYQIHSHRRISTQTQKVSIVIFPLENLSGDANLQYLSIGIPNTLHYSLSQLENVSIEPITIAQEYEGKSYNPRDEGKKLTVDNVVTGSFKIINNNLSLNLQVTDISKENSFMQQQHFDAPLDDLTGLQQKISQFLIFQLNLSNNNAELLKIQQLSQTNPAAYENYMRGINATVKAHRELAIFHFNKALKFDPNFLPALEYQGINYINQASYGGCGKTCSDKGIESYQKIIQISPSYQRANLSLAMAYLQSNEIDEAIRLTRNFVVVNPESKYADFVLSEIYRFAGALDESVEIVEKEWKDDDVDSPVNQIIMAYLYRGEYEKFLESMRYTDNNDYGAFYSGLAYLYLNRPEQALEKFDYAYLSNPKPLTSKMGKFYFYFLQKKDLEAKLILEEINRLIEEKQIENGEIIFAAAQANAVLKQNKKALEMFNLSVEKGFFCYPYFATDRLLQNIRNEPEFQKILQNSKTKHEEFKRKYGQ